MRYSWLGLLTLVWAQDADLFLGSEIYSYLERWDVRAKLTSPIPIETRPWGKEEAYGWLLELDPNQLHPLDRARYRRALFLLGDTLPARRRFLTGLFPERRDLVVARHEGLELYAGPLLWGYLGRDTASTLLYQNTRGAYLRLRLGKKVALYGDFLETQTRPPFFVQTRYTLYQTLWGEAFVKPFRSTGFDYTNTRGYLTYTPNRYLRLKVGRDKAFWGMGFQSLSLGDYAPEYLYLHLRWRTHRWEYHTLFAQLIDFLPNKPDAWGDHPRKYAALHQFIWRPRRTLSIGVWEGLMYNPWTPRGPRGLELNYFIPIIFYRSIEQVLGSPDNAFIGIFGRANLLRRLQLYGQLIIDDYNFSKRREGRGWWGNKYAWQVGLKVFDLGLPTLDLRLELTEIRPYTYSHSNVGANWSHYGQFLAHPYGANLRDFTALLTWQPLPGLTLEGRASFIQQGQNRPGENWGSDIFQTDMTYMRAFGNQLLQGERTTYRLLHGRLIYQPTLLPLYLEAEGFHRNNLIGALVGLRWMLPPKVLRF
ncbi:MAG: hypothetical protein NZ958_04070 [Bacteroidia bacterium]|nr:hypothetical protein [Bacteroidia bacterium]MDW8088394.1 hypothetical protein [Bacteroidia bacterium]